jgi:hypothetical protein
MLYNDCWCSWKRPSGGFCPGHHDTILHLAETLQLKVDDALRAAIAGTPTRATITA